MRVCASVFEGRWGQGLGFLLLKALFVRLRPCLALLHYRLGGDAAIKTLPCPAPVGKKLKPEAPKHTHTQAHKYSLVNSFIMSMD